MCITKTELQEILDKNKEDLKKFVRKEDEKWYHKASTLMHTSSPETKSAISTFKTDIQYIKDNIATHTKREEGYWEKIDTLDASLTALANSFQTHTEEMKTHTEAIRVLSDVFASGRILKAIATFIGWCLVITGGVVALKQWIIK